MISRVSEAFLQLIFERAANLIARDIVSVSSIKPLCYCWKPSPLLTSAGDMAMQKVCCSPLVLQCGGHVALSSAFNACLLSCAISLLRMDSSPGSSRILVQMLRTDSRNPAQLEQFVSAWRRQLHNALCLSLLRRIVCCEYGCSEAARTSCTTCVHMDVWMTCTAHIVQRHLVHCAGPAVPASSSANRPMCRSVRC